MPTSRFDGMQIPPRVLTVAGSDSGGGAGIQADLKTMLALGTHGMSALTAVTAQNSLGVQGAWELPAEAVRAQFRSVVEDIGVQAVKTGMLSSAVLVEAVAELSPPCGCRSSSTPSGSPSTATRCWPKAPSTPCAPQLLPTATVATPNLDEVAQLTGVHVAQEADMRQAADRDPGARAALGADQGRTPAARLEQEDGGAPWTCSPTEPRSTGCAPLATTTGTPTAPAAPSPRPSPRSSRKGETVPQAVAAAKDYVTGAIAAGFRLGAGIGPVDHGWRHPRRALTAGRGTGRALPARARTAPGKAKAGPSLDGPAFPSNRLGCATAKTSARDLAGLDARGAGVQPLRRAPDHCTHRLDVGVPTTVGTAMRVRDTLAEARPLATDVAVGSHGSLQRLQMHLR